jgi:hypothetical protein
MDDACYQTCLFDALPATCRDAALHQLLRWTTWLSCMVDARDGRPPDERIAQVAPACCRDQLSPACSCRKSITTSGMLWSLTSRNHVCKRSSKDKARHREAKNQCSVEARKEGRRCYERKELALHPPLHTTTSGHWSNSSDRRTTVALSPSDVCRNYISAMSRITTSLLRPSSCAVIHSSTVATGSECMPSSKSSVAFLKKTMVNQK